MKKNIAIVLTLLLTFTFILQGCSSNGASGNNDEELKTIRLDYAYYSPASLILKHHGWAEEEFGKDGVKVEWTLSQGSNKALEFLTSNSIDFGSAAGAATLITKTKDVPIKNIYIASTPEWTALLTKDPSIQKVEDLKGKKVAATYGTDPYIFLLRALNEAGLSEKDIQFVNLQHQDGYQALLKGDVDAWAGLDPIMATAELKGGAKIFYRNIDFNTYNFLNVRKEFAEKHPEAVEKVIRLYEKARAWILEHPEETAEIIAKEAQIDLDVAKKQLDRTKFDVYIPSDEQKEALHAAGDILQKAGVIDQKADLTKHIDELIDPSFAEKASK
ncbi:aliphatic sulfonate ABC transporter substrate-binding protein [Ureibacillus sp. FSL K6-8385]|uniref:Putative aliphatic sulfonates-binding protein n=1 Tax=Ureibacillus terrenus TaxID=118246 RepID=A0A540V5N1_9BACL|nr:aliphatic sulfonate ABC transporter substrate-binding protein [Ureibacillus terrenus]MED3661279.1 aliphatic sulfonate ABC transporter substrate-binding protein [Ureibacillus terrenus]MED3764247.1 aliphatic sulfonate ABC transporter substrate-binding protein [Ureibacillus terrenus]TQE92066.1 aliphatic sulfonate ABC transporter substrate-binding protein [Ureibacillus terrenus]